MSLISLVYAESQESYNINKNQFMNKLRRRNKLEFVNYFNSNWENCKEKWVFYLRKDCAHLGNNTNNRLEASWGKLKVGLSRHTPIDFAIGEIVVRQLMRETEYIMKIQQACLRTRINYNSDVEMSRVYHCTTDFAAKLIQEQYDFATKVCDGV